MSCLRNRLTLDYPNSKGETLRATLESVFRQSTDAGKPYKDARLDLPVYPQKGSFVWDAFWSLNSSRLGTGYGPAPISCGEILSWIALYKLPLANWEIDALRAMDAVYMSEVQRIISEDSE